MLETRSFPPFDDLPGSVVDLLATRREAVLGTQRADGGPLLCPVWYLWTGSTFTISAPVASAKVRHIRVRPDVTICVHDPDAGRYVTAYGRGEIVDGDDVGQLTNALLLKYMHGPEAEARWGWLSTKHTRVAIVMTPDRLIWRDGVH